MDFQAYMRNGQMLLERAFAPKPNMALHEPGEFISDQIRSTKRHYEFSELHWVRRHFDFSNFLDIGANIGNHCNYFAHYGARGWAFEPASSNYSLLTKNAPTFECYQIALTESEGAVEFVTYPDSMGNSYVKELFGESVQKWGSDPKIEIVRCAPLDSFEIDGPTLAKIDVEGAELLTLKGASETLIKFKPAIWIEIHTDQTLANGNFPYRRAEIHSMLEALGYRHHSSRGNTNHFLSRLDIVARSFS